MKNILLYILLIPFLYSSCSSVIEEPSDTGIKFFLTGQISKSWNLPINANDCNSNLITSLSTLQFLPNGTFQVSGNSNFCQWNIESENSPKGKRDYLTFNNYRFEIKLDKYSTDFFYIKSTIDNNWAIATLTNISTTGSVMDIDGNSYNTVLINGKVWMAENLKVTRMNDGTPIMTAPNGVVGWDTIFDRPGMTWKNNDPATMSSNGVGAYYNFYAVQSSKKLCPTGFHVSTESDWNNLSSYAGGDGIAADALKSTTISGGTDSYGFNALNPGFVSENNTFVASYGIWWINSAVNSTTSKTINIAFPSNLERLDVDNHAGLSVRCVQD